MDINTLVGPKSMLETSATAATCTVTIPVNGQPNQVPWLDGYTVSASAAPSAAVVGTIAGLVGGTMHINIPASAFTPFGEFYSISPIPASGTQAIVLSVPSLGVVCTVRAYFHYAAAPLS